MHALLHEQSNHSHPFQQHHPQSGIAPSPALLAGASQALPSPPLSDVHDSRIYCLEVAQQPVNARMCGLSDKSRRPISPPVCVRLTVLDADTLRKIDVSVLDVSSLVLTVELFNESGTDDLNLVHYAPKSGREKLGSGPATSYNSMVPYPTPSPLLPPYEPILEQYLPSPSLPPPLPPQQYYVPPPVPDWGYTPLLKTMPAMHPQLPPPTARFIRNLTGNLCANAVQLADPDGKPRIWFILQDLSVRMKGSYRLKMDLVDVGTLSYSSSGISLDNACDDVRASMSTETATPGKRATALNNVSAPVLATILSDVFHVYLAKEFPGVVKNTALSECFASQGIRMRISKNRTRRRSGTGVVTGSDIISEA